MASDWLIFERMNLYFQIVWEIGNEAGKSFDYCKCCAIEYGIEVLIFNLL